MSFNRVLSFLLFAFGIAIAISIVKRVSQLRKDNPGHPVNVVQASKLVWPFTLFFDTPTDIDIYGSVNKSPLNTVGDPAIAPENVPQDAVGELRQDFVGPPGGGN